MTAALFEDAVTGGQSQTGPLTNAFGGRRAGIRHPDAACDEQHQPGERSLSPELIEPISDTRLNFANG
jgi:hypothetical protein